MNPSKKITCVTSAEETQIITTAAIRNKPALYLQPITQYYQENTHKRSNKKLPRSRNFKKMKTQDYFYGS